MARVKELLDDDFDMPDHDLGAGYAVYTLDHAVRDLDQFSTNQLANELSDLEDIRDRLTDMISRIQNRIEKLKARENYHAATSRYR